MINVPDIFGSLVFNDKVMRAKLPKETYKALRACIEKGAHLDANVASVVASAMKEWAMEKGATHFTHWFQPMTGITAEKHDSFLSPYGEDGVIMEFSGKELIKGEPDASSFPSGGLRSTFEARGYTTWDPTSYAFIKDETLCIPTAFCSYQGEALDKKTPLLRSIQAVEKQAFRILKLFGAKAKKAVSTVGPEQEYFLIDKSVYDKRPDLIFCRRTLLGAKPPKGQEMDDHYFGAIKPRVSSFMKELDMELWKLGIYAKTKHNEAAPCQHELAPIYTLTNKATDHNQLTMEIMKKVADRHNLVCLLHEKPFAGVNGSGKHNNWSLATDSGVNLLEPGDTPEENAQFILFLVSVIKAVDEYQDLLRVSVATHGNDHRLGANEAPPAILSIFLGEELMDILECIEVGSYHKGKKKVEMELGVTVLPYFPKDTTDRNRTSPFAFTGNKFEFRMPGASLSVSGPNIVLNTIVANSLQEFADALENSTDFKKELNSLMIKTIKEHKRIIFNGNNYSEEWKKEAERRGLLNLESTPKALPYFCKPKNIELFKKHAIFSEAEVVSRCEILLENYNKSINIEALTIIDMVKRSIIPSIFSFETKLARLIKDKTEISIDASLERETLINITKLSRSLSNNTGLLQNKLADTKNFVDSELLANYFHDTILVLMQEIREMTDELENLVGKEDWPFPSYGEILTSVF